MATDFIHLHVHSEYSLLDGLGRINALVDRAKEYGMDALGITDHGVLYGAIDFYTAAKKAHIKPIVGCEVYVAPNSRFDKRPKVDTSPYHLVLLAKDQTGYQNLIKLVTKAHVEGFYYKPRVDRELLAQHSDGLICLSACASGEVPRFLFNGDTEGARQAAKWYLDVFGRENYYIELQRHDWQELEAVNRELVSLSRDLDLSLVATNDVHYVNAEDADTQELLLCVQTNTTMQDPKRLRMQGQTYFLKTPDEMARLFGELPQALLTTREIAERCNLKLEFGRIQLPEFALPPGHTPDSYLEHLCREGLRQRYDHITSEVEDRLRYELEVIRQTGFAQYILIVWDIFAYARRNGIVCGPRGSAAGAIVLYLLGISDVDPVKYKLTFERFLNPERAELPDVDMDFADDRRDEMINYVTEKYGRDHVAQIITFGTLGAKAAIRDVGRAMAMPLPLVDRVAKLIPSLPLHMTIEQSMHERTELRDLYKEDPAVQQLIDSAKRVEGVTRHASTHAAGVVISREPLIAYTPIQPTSRDDTNLMTQFHADNLAKIGLLKMDFLGLANLTILGSAVEIIKREQGIQLDLLKIPFDDPKTFELLGNGETIGVFQLEGRGMTAYLRELKPSSVDDLTAMIALYRPGPMANIPQYVARKHGREPVTYPHPLLEDILEDSYGVMTYQDQVLLVLRKVAGYSLGQADIVRKAMGKKIRSLMEQEKVRFSEGCQRNGLSDDEAESLWNLLEPFSGYGFNRAHAACYAQIAYQTAYLKANFTVEFMVAVLAAAMGNADKVVTALTECRRLGIQVLGPDVNHSEVGFRIEPDPRSGENKKAIRFGLAAIKGIGEGAVEALVAARRSGGAFTSIDDFCGRVDVRQMNKRVLESLIKSGAFDSLGRRSQLLAVLDRMIGIAQQVQRAHEVGQTSLFDVLPSDHAVASIALPNLPETPSKEKLAWEKELLGVYFSEHPLKQAASDLEEVVTALCGEIDEEYVGQRVTVAGILTGVRQLMTKKRDAMAAATLEDLSGTMDVVAFPRTYEKTKDLWRDDAIVVIQGKIDTREERLQIICDAGEVYQPGLRQPEDGFARSDDDAPPMGLLAGEEESEFAEAGASLAGISVSTGRDDGDARSPVDLAVSRNANHQRSSNGYTNGHVKHNVDDNGGAGALNGKVAAPPGGTVGKDTTLSGRGRGRRRLVVTLWRGDNATQDLQQFQEIVNLLQGQVPGNDEVRLAIAGGGRERVEFESPDLRIRCDTPFERQLARLLGERAVSSEPIAE